MRQAQFADVASHGPTELHQAIADIHENLSETGAELHPQPTPTFYEAPSEPIATPEPQLQPAPKPRAKRSATPATAKSPAKPRARKTAEPKA
jgi:hypothetical protein